MDKSELPEGYDTGNTFESPCIDVPIYLLWLLKQARSRGVSFGRRKIQHISDAKLAHVSGRADVVINCSGFESYSLGGIEDRSIYPARGQICLVENEANGLLTTSGTDDPDGEIMYVQSRVGGMCSPDGIDFSAFRILDFRI